MFTSHGYYLRFISLGAPDCTATIRGQRLIKEIWYFRYYQITLCQFCTWKQCLKRSTRRCGNVAIKRLLSQVIREDKIWATFHLLLRELCEQFHNLYGQNSHSCALSVLGAGCERNRPWTESQRSQYKTLAMKVIAHMWTKWLHHHY